MKSLEHYLSAIKESCEHPIQYRALTSNRLFTFIVCLQCGDTARVV